MLLKYFVLQRGVLRGRSNNCLTVERQLSSERLYWGCHTLRAIKDEDIYKVKEGICDWPKIRDVLHDGDPSLWTGHNINLISEWVRAEALIIYALAGKVF